MTEIRFTSEIAVEEVQHVGSDAMIAAAARVSTGRDRASQSRYYCPRHSALTDDWKACELCPKYRNQEDSDAGLIRFLMKSRHGTPFEHGLLTVRVHAPIKVWREWHRHRVGWSYNEESGRYKQLDPLFYIPPRGRPMIRPEGFESARPAFDVATDDEYECVRASLQSGYKDAYAQYEYMLLSLQVDRGLARDVLGVGVYSACYCTANPRSILHFLELRTDHPEAKRPSKPLYEIRVAADKLEAIFAARWPLVYAAFIENGRAAP